MKWIVAERMRAHIVGFTGVNFSGVRMEVDIWPSGSRKGEIDGSRIKCIGIIAPVGTRLVLRQSTAETGWEDYGWRAIEIREGFTFESRDGKRVGVQVPELDVMDRPGALYTDTEFPQGYVQSNGLDERPSWTYGRSATTPLRERIRCIMVDWVGD